ncbi:helix-turn-helix domain-containing protein [Acinetobacter radioresistens]|uniref:hypothetical protein n=1 Tax=Acinetobacter radioresistens TaxID=40216 RepID=UPI0022459121|nr:hypothetical protein [Acinetobacter radioresistens]MCX0332067.1 helix-turn-helix domain-containing protein [Acinetobacter radioresistens]
MIKGTWQIVQWCPDLATREWLNIGVGFREADNQYFKFLSDFKKVEALYNSDTKHHLVAVLELVKGFFSKGYFDFSHQIKILEIGFQQGISVEENLNRSYERIVTLRGVNDKHFGG